MPRSPSINLALLLSRGIVALIFLWHGVPKAVDWPAAMDEFVGFGLPGFLGPVTGIVEVMAATMLLLGVGHRVAAGILMAVIAGAIATVQIPGGVTAALERDLLILVATFLLWVVGPGAFGFRAREATNR
jgi:putative oxidoreductase